MHTPRRPRETGMVELKSLTLSTAAFPLSPRFLSFPRNTLLLLQLNTSSYVSSPRVIRFIIHSSLSGLLSPRF